MVDTRVGTTVASARFPDGVPEVFAVQVLPSLRHPDPFDDQSRTAADSFVLPHDSPHK